MLAVVYGVYLPVLILMLRDPLTRSILLEAGAWSGQLCARSACYLAREGFQRLAYRKREDPQ